MLRELQPSFRSPSSCTVVLPCKKTLPVFVALHTRAMSSALRKDCCNCTSGTMQKYKFGLRWGTDQERLTEPVSGMSFRTHVILIVLEDQILHSPRWNCSLSPRWEERSLSVQQSSSDKEREMLMAFSQILCDSPGEMSVCVAFPQYTVWPGIDDWGFGTRKMSTGLGAY